MYTNSYHEEINRALRFGEKREKYNLLIEDLFCSIKQLSKKNECNNENGDPLYRGTGPYYGVDFTEGSTIIFSGFTSTSPEITVPNYFNEKGGYLLYMFGRSCAHISSASTYPSEKEVLFSNSTKFKVLCKRGKKVVLKEENTTYKRTAGHVNILPDLNEKNKALALCDELIES